MKRVTHDTLSLSEKQALLKELKMDELLNLFKGKYANKNFAPKQPKTSLDQLVSITINQAEKDFLGRELVAIRKVGPGVSVSSFVRSRATSDIDIAQWYDIAVEGLKKLTSSDYNEKELQKQKRLYLKLLDNTSYSDSEEDKENAYLYSRKLKQINGRLEELKRKTVKRKFRLSSRTSFNESNHIRWRAARLNITVSDYIRFLIFGYTPMSDGDSHLSADARKRFYISIIDVFKNGWGEPPKMNGCPHCQNYEADIQALKEELQIYRSKYEGKVRA